jgi:hypothetical protein
MAGDRIENGADGLRPHQGRRAAAEEHAADHPARRPGGGVGDLAPEGGDETLLVDGRAPHMAVEVAIRAFGEAEGPVHVDAEAGVAGGVIDHQADVSRVDGFGKASHRGMAHSVPALTLFAIRRSLFARL